MLFYLMNLIIMYYVFCKIINDWFLICKIGFKCIICFGLYIFGIILVICGELYISFCIKFVVVIIVIVDKYYDLYFYLEVYILEVLYVFFIMILIVFCVF